MAFELEAPQDCNPDTGEGCEGSDTWWIIV